MHFQYSLHKLLLNKLLLLQQSTLFYLLLVTFFAGCFFFPFLYQNVPIVTCLSARFAGECRTKGRNEWNLLVSVA